MRPGRATLAGPAGACTLDADDLLDLLIPAHGTRVAVEDVCSATGLTLERLPVLPWVWGLDSI